MGIKLGREATYAYPCDIRFPSERNPGQFTTHRVEVTFQSMPTEQSRQMLQEASAAGETAGLDKEILREVVIGWNDGIDEPFNEENLEIAMDNVFILAGLIEGYRASVSREAAQARKKKKLTEAARAWVRGELADDVADEAELNADRALLAIPEPAADQVRSAFLLWPENRDSFQAFLACGTQWRWVPVIGPQGGTVVRTGLDYPGARAALEMMDIEVTPQLFADIQVLESAAIAEWARQRES